MADEKPKDPASDYLAKLAELTKTLEENKEKIEEFARNLELLARTSSGFSPEVAETVRKALLQTDAQKEVQAAVLALGKNLDPLAHVGVQMREFAEASKKLQDLLQMTRAGKLGEISPDTPISELWELAERVKAAEQKRAADTNQVDNTAVNVWFTEHWKEPRQCAVCSQSNWAMAPRFTHIPMGPVGLHQPIPKLPCVVVTCQTCGNTLFFNALVMELLPKEQG
jgi:hypothetical protein